MEGIQKQKPKKNEEKYDFHYIFIPIFITAKICGLWPQTLRVSSNPVFVVVYLCELLASSQDNYKPISGADVTLTLIPYSLIS